MTDITQIIIAAIIFILPAYIANSTAALFGFGKPIDFGKKLRDGRRVFGDGKTFAGFIIGVFFGTVTGGIEGFLIQQTPFAIGSISLYTMLGFALGFGAMFGDLAGSFFKRRLGMERGAPAPFLDQLDFIVGALLCASPLVVPEAGQILVIVLLTPFLHLMLNFIGWKLKLKKVPW